ncbi:MAG: fumarylacetoacetate hydrolase family protein [Meiothermus sp.]|uniref:fumarylacetoacetate hydrolase family protein n=1 Tax=Meiothermus sp. TaxID=1955249 RepID=UPI002621340A|nr:fumarylacetoacetate hydrolase family protein [Meiothermus sp.]MCS7059427.1 fumarylacetoacetate hydrolase family protein [Meiothermus sp.]
MSEQPFYLGTFRAGGGPPFAGLVLEGQVVAVAALAPLCRRLGFELFQPESVLGLLDDWGRNYPALERAVEAIRAGEAGALPFIAEAQLQTLPPVYLPRQIFCSGANYKKHVVDLIVAQGGPHLAGKSDAERREWGQRRMDERARRGKPFIFTKLPTSVIGPYDTLWLPPEVQQADWELELGVVMGRPARRVRREEALDYVAGYVVVNDITARELVYRPDIPEMGMDWLASKNAPGFLPMGPYLTPAAFVPDPQNLTITLRLNDQVMQHESTADMIFGVAQLIEFISAHVQLLPGDLICTGSPAGNGMHYGRFLQEGDLMEGSITGLGTQRILCRLEEVAGQPEAAKYASEEVG